MGQLGWRTGEEGWEVGAFGGYGWYRNARVFSGPERADAGIRNRFVVGAVVCEDAFDHFSGEFRYVYHDGDPFLSARGIRENVQGQSHTVAYDLLIHAYRREARVRPYLAVGGGVKVYRVSGPPLQTQQLSSIATLSDRNDVRPVLSVGAGVKFRLGKGAIARFDFRDYVTPFPRTLIQPALFATGRGYLQQFTPTVGISYGF